MSGLTDAQREIRRLSIGGSDARIIVSGDKGAIDRLWLEKVGRPVIEDDRGLPAAMGAWTEELNRRWFTQETGHAVIKAGHRAVHPKIPWLTATLDGSIPRGEIAEHAVLFEAKHVNPFNFEFDAVVDEYMPQLQHAMYVTELPQAAFSVFVGTMKWVWTLVDFDPFYHADLLEAERAFWQSVKNETPPDGWQVGRMVGPGTVDMSVNQRWLELAERYISTKSQLEQSTDMLRAMLPRGASEAIGGRLSIKRDARGTPRIKIVGETDG